MIVVFMHPVSDVDSVARVTDSTSAKPGLDALFRQDEVEPGASGHEHDTEADIPVRGYERRGAGTVAAP